MQALYLEIKNLIISTLNLDELTADDIDTDAALFGALWPLGETVKLDATVDRRVLRQQRDRLDKLGYEFAPLSQDWHLKAA